MEILIGKLLEFGTVPSLLVLTFVVALMVKKIEENGKKDESRNLELRTFMSAEMNALEDRFEARFVVTDKRVEELSTRISCVNESELSCQHRGEVARPQPGRGRRWDNRTPCFARCEALGDGPRARRRAAP